MDEWLIAEPGSGTKTYLVHTHAPYLIFEVFNEPQLATWEFATRDGQILVPAKFISCDPFYTDALKHLAKEAAKALAYYDSRRESEIYDTFGEDA